MCAGKRPIDGTPVILKLLVEGRFPRCLGPNSAMRDLRQLLIHRHKLVQIRSRVKNELQHLMMNQGVQQKYKLWSVQGRTELEQLPLQNWAGRRREDLLGLLKMLEQEIERMDEAVTTAAQEDRQTRLLMTQPGVGPVTALAFSLTIGDVSRSDTATKSPVYLGLIPREASPEASSAWALSASRVTGAACAAGGSCQLSNAF
jgi:transposase